MLSKREIVLDIIFLLYQIERQRISEVTETIGHNESIVFLRSNVVFSKLAVYGFAVRVDS